MAPVMLHLRCYVRPAPPSHCLPVRSIFPVAREQRKLAAIVAAEVVGYSPAHELAESGTKELGPGTRTLRRARAKLTGDSAWLASLEIAHFAQLVAPPMP